MALKEKGNESPPSSLRSPEVDSQGTQSSDGALGSGKSLRVERGKRVSYLARLAGVVEGVDVLGAEVHHPAVDSVEIRASGGVAEVAAPRWRLRWAPGCRRPQEPGQRAEQRAEQLEPRTASHGGRRAPPPGRAPWRGGERRAASSKAPCGSGRRRSAARAMPGKPHRRALASHWRRADQILMQPRVVSTRSHRLGVGEARGTGAGGCCFALRLLRSFPSFLISENPALTQPEFQPIAFP